MAGWFFLVLLASSVVFVLARGGSEERVVAGTLLLVSAATPVLYVLAGEQFTRISLPLLLNEAILLTVTLIIAYRSSRFWPMPVASLEVAAFLTLLTPLFGQNLVSHALGVTQGIWAYPQLLILVLAVVRGRNRSRTAAKREST